MNADSDKRRDTDFKPPSLRWPQGMMPSAALKAQIETLAKNQGRTVKRLIWELIILGLEKYEHRDQSISATVAVPLVLDSALHGKLAEKAKAERRSVQWIIRVAIRELFAATLMNRAQRSSSRSTCAGSLENLERSDTAVAA
jgi:hypothetical protein